MAGHGHDAHGAHGHDGHGHGHVDTSGDKGAAFVGLLGGMAILGALMFGVVQWTNTRYAGHEGGEKPAAEAAR